MVRSLVITGALIIALGGGVQAQSAVGGGLEHPAGARAGVEALPTSDYVYAATQTDGYEISAARVVRDRLRNSRLRRFAQGMMRDHTRSTHMMLATVRRSGHALPPPSPLLPEQQHMLQELRHAGPDLGRVYIDQQVRAHETALALHEAYAAGGADPMFRHTAAVIVPVVRMHLQMARDLAARPH